MNTVFNMALAAAIVHMQERFFKIPCGQRELRLIDLGDDVISAMGFSPKDWGSWYIEDGIVRIYDEVP